MGLQIGIPVTSLAFRGSQYKRWFPQGGWWLQLKNKIHIPTFWSHTVLMIISKHSTNECIRSSLAKFWALLKLSRHPSIFVNGGTVTTNGQCKTTSAWVNLQPQSIILAHWIFIPYITVQWNSAWYDKSWTSRCANHYLEENKIFKKWKGNLLEFLLSNLNQTGCLKTFSL